MSLFVRVGMSAEDWRKLARMIDDSIEYPDGSLDRGVVSGTKLRNAMEAEAARSEREDAVVDDVS